MFRWSRNARERVRGKTRDLVLVAIMSATSVVLTRFASIRIAIGGIEGIRIGLGSVPNVLAGFVVSPVAGAVSGALADVVGFFLSPMGSYMPHFTLTSALAGFIPGAFYRRVLKRQGQRLETWACAASILCGNVIVSVGLTPYFLHSLFGLPLQVLLPARFVSLLFEVPLSTYFIRVVSEPLVRLRQLPDGSSL